MCVLWHLFGMHRPTTTTYPSPRTGVCGGLFPHKITVLVWGWGGVESRSSSPAAETYTLSRSENQQNWRSQEGADRVPERSPNLHLPGNQILLMHGCETRVGDGPHPRFADRDLASASAALPPCSVPCDI